MAGIRQKNNRPADTGSQQGSPQDRQDQAIHQEHLMMMNVDVCILA